MISFANIFVFIASVICSSQAAATGYTLDRPVIARAGSPGNCPGGSYITGLNCNNGDCNEMKVGCRRSYDKNVKLTRAGGWTSDVFTGGSGGQFCPTAKDVVISISCEGNDCSSMKITCQTMLKGETPVEWAEHEGDSCYWTGWLGDIDPEKAEGGLAIPRCHSIDGETQLSHAMRGIECKDGESCKKMRLYCCAPRAFR